MIQRPQPLQRSVASVVTPLWFVICYLQNNSEVYTARIPLSGGEIRYSTFAYKGLKYDRHVLL